MGDPTTSGTGNTALRAAPAVAAGLAGSVAAGVPIGAAAATALLLPAAAIDLRERRLPDPILSAAAAVLVLAVVAGAATGSSTDLLGMLAGAAAMSAPLLVVHLVSPAAMGFGDVKLAVVLGAATGSPVLALVALALGSGGTAVVGIAAGRRTVPFGPGLVGATMLVLVVAALTGWSATGLTGTGWDSAEPAALDVTLGLLP